MSDEQCPTCRGTGTYLYSDSSMGMGGIAGQVITEGPCPGWRNGQPGRRLDMSNCPHWHSPYRDYSKGSAHQQETP